MRERWPRVRRLHGSRRRVPRRGVPHADAAPAERRLRRRLAAGEARAEAAPPRRQATCSASSACMSMSTVEFTEEWFESEAGARGHRRGRHPWLHARLDVGGHRLHADAQLAATAAGSAHRPIDGRQCGDRRRARRRAEGATAASCARRPASKRILVDEQRATRRAARRAAKRSARRPCSRPPIRATRCSAWSARRNCRRNSSGTRSRSRCAARSPRCTCCTDGNHGLPAGTLAIAPTLKYLERAYDAAKYGEIVAAPVSGSHDGRRRRVDPLPVRAVQAARQRLEPTRARRSSASRSTRWRRTSRALKASIREMRTIDAARTWNRPTA